MVCGDEKGRDGMGGEGGPMGKPQHYMCIYLCLIQYFLH